MFRHRISHFIKIIVARSRFVYYKYMLNTISARQINCINTRCISKTEECFYAKQKLHLDLYE